MMITSFIVDYFKMDGIRYSLKIYRNDGQPLRVRIIEDDEVAMDTFQIGKIHVYDKNRLQIDSSTSLVKSAESLDVFEFEYRDLPTTGLGAGALYSTIFEKGVNLEDYEILCPYKYAKQKKHKLGGSKIYYDPERQMTFVTNHLSSSSKGTVSFLVRCKLTRSDIFLARDQCNLDLKELSRITDCKLPVDLHMDNKGIGFLLKFIWDKVELSPNFYGIGVNFKKSKE